MTKDGLIEQYSEPVTFNDGSGGDAINIFHLKDILRLNEQHIYENHEVLQKWKEDIRKECQQPSEADVVEAIDDLSYMSSTHRMPSPRDGYECGVGDAIAAVKALYEGKE